MAQADEDAAIKLQVAILSVHNFPRGFSNIYNYFNASFQDTKIQPVVRDILSQLLQINAFCFTSNYFDNEPPFQLEDVMISGSASEGTLKLNFMEETLSDNDFMLVLKNIQVTEADQRKGNLPVKKNTTFVNLYLTDPDLLRTWSEFLEISHKPKYEIAKLSSRKLKDRVRENYSKNVLFTLPIYFVLAIQCNGWPLCAQEWILRPRCWPSQDLVQTIVKEGFHIVCKSSPEGDFRLSYFNAETLLIGNLSDLQFKAYRAFKSFISHYKKSWSPNARKAVCSYHLKTIVLWYCEKSDPIDWTEDRIAGHLLSLIDDLILAINEKNLPMYFMPKYNLMDRLKGKIEAVEQIRELRLNLNYITKAIFSEELNFRDRLKFARDVFPDKAFKVIFSKSFVTSTN